MWIFRDQTGLAVTPSLWSSIQDALNSSEYFVLMASPEAAQSPWVNKEIQHWVQEKSPQRILPVVTDGEWRWDPETNDFSTDSTAVPSALRGVFTEEPLFLDLRWAREDGHLSLRHTRFRDAIARLAAPMHGVSKDDLEGEDVRLHRRARRLRSVAIASLAVLTLVATLTGVVAVRTAERANASAAEAVLQQKRAAEQESNADRSADEASRQQENAKVQELRAKAAVVETRRQEKRALQQRKLADKASAEAARQQADARRQAKHARTQRQAAESASKRAREQEELARRQRYLAKKAGKQARLQKEIARVQTELAAAAKEEAKLQKAAAELQKQLAQEAAEETELQQALARKQQQLAEEAKAEATKQKANADQQQRIAIGRRVNNEAKALIIDDPHTALMLGTAAAKVQGDDEARGQLAGFVTSTQYAGTIAAGKKVQYSTNDVVIAQDLQDNVALWNVSNRAKPTLLGTLGNYPDWTVSPDGSTVAAADDENYVVLIDVTKPVSPKMLSRIPAAYWISNLTWNQDGSRLFVGAYDEKGNDVGDLWNVSSPRTPVPLATRFGGLYPVRLATFSPDGEALVTYTSYRIMDATAVWDLTDPYHVKQVGTLDKLVWDIFPSVTALAFIRAKSILVVDHNGGSVVDLTDPAEPRWAEQFFDDLTGIIAVSSDGSQIVASGPGSRTILYQVVFSKASPSSPPLPADYGPPLPVVDDPPPPTDGQQPPTGGPQPPTDDDPPPPPPPPGDVPPSDPTVGLEALTQVTDPDGTGSTALSPDGRTLITVDYTNKAKQWNVVPYGGPVLGANLDEIGVQGLAAAYPTNRSMVTIGTAAEVQVWDVTDPSVPVKGTTAAVQAAPIHHAAFTPDGRILATADHAGNVRVSDLTNPGKPVTIAKFNDPEAAREEVLELVISPDGRTVGFGHSSTVLWDVARARTATRFGPLVGDHLAFSPDGRTFALRDDDSHAASLWTMDGLTGPTRLGELGRFPRTGITAIAFSPDGRTVAMGSSKGAGIWDISTPKHPRQSGRFATPVWVSSIVFSSDGQTIAAVDHDDYGGRVTMWGTTGQTNPVQIASFFLRQPGAEESPLRATFSPDGKTLTTSGIDVSDSRGTAKLWHLNALSEVRADPVRQACVMTGAGLNEDEWADWITEIPYEPTC